MSELMLAVRTARAGEQNHVDLVPIDQPLPESFPQIVRTAESQSSQKPEGAYADDQGNFIVVWKRVTQQSGRHAIDVIVLSGEAVGRVDKEDAKAKLGDWLAHDLDQLLKQSNSHSQGAELRESKQLNTLLAELKNTKDRQNATVIGSPKHKHEKRPRWSINKICMIAVVFLVIGWIAWAFFDRSNAANQKASEQQSSKEQGDTNALAGAHEAGDSRESQRKRTTKDKEKEKAKAPESTKEKKAEDPLNLQLKDIADDWNNAQLVKCDWTADSVNNVISEALKRNKEARVPDITLESAVEQLTNAWKSGKNAHAKYILLSRDLTEYKDLQGLYPGLQPSYICNDRPKHLVVYLPLFAGVKLDFVYTKSLMQSHELARFAALLDRLKTAAKKIEIDKWVVSGEAGKRQRAGKYFKELVQKLRGMELPAKDQQESVDLPFLEGKHGRIAMVLLGLPKHEEKDFDSIKIHINSLNEDDVNQKIKDQFNSLLELMAKEDVQALLTLRPRVKD
jgi:cytoskeletal protein RodZ